MDLLPKQMCHRCSYKLEEFHKFYIDCLKTDAALKSQLSWMRKDNQKERIGVPMVHIENVKIKTEIDPHEIDPLMESVSLVEFPVSGVQTGLPDCIMYTSFANTSRCQCYYDKADPARQAISKDCTHPTQFDLRKSTDLTYRLNGVSVPPEPEILWKKRKNLFGLTADPPKSTTNQEKPSAAPAFTENTLPKTEQVPRTLRPRKRSVDYVGTKRKAPATDAENGTKSSTEPPIGDLIIIKDEPLEVEVEPPRTLRPRKHPEAEDMHEENRSKSAERCRKRIKTSPVKPRRSNSLAQEVLERQIKQEVLDITDDGEELILRLKTEPLDPDSSLMSSPSPKKRKDAPKVAREVAKEVPNVAKEVVKEVPKLVKVGPKINKDELLVKAIDICKEGLSFSKVAAKTGLVGKEEFKVGRVLVKRSSKVCFSPKNLRSQDLHLRSGKVKVKDALKPQFRRDFKKHHEKMMENAKTKVLKLASVDLKQLCEKCNISFANKELFRLHACYSN